jgi:hypothetical protein
MAEAESKPENTEVRRDEALYEISREAWRTELERFKSAEEKAHRYLTFSLGALAAGSFAVAPIASILRQGGGFREFVLLAAFMASALLLAAAVVNAVVALQVGKTKGLPIEHLYDYYTRKRYPDLLRAMAHQFLKAAEIDRKRVNRTYLRIRRSYMLLVVGAAVGASAATFFSLTNRAGG